MVRGLRIAEALNLTRKEAPVTTDALVIKGKGNKERMVPILPVIAEAMADYLTACPFGLAPDDPLFVGVRGKKLSAGVFQKTVRHVRQSLGLPENGNATCIPP